MARGNHLLSQAPSNPRIASEIRKSRQSLEAAGLAPPPSDDFVAFISFADKIRHGMILAGVPRTAERLSLHIDYVATKASKAISQLRAGEIGSLDDQVVIDAVVNITAVLLDSREVLNAINSPAKSGLPAAVFETIILAEANLEGWCSRGKAETLAAYILREKPKICVEIGVFGGRSLVPCAAALKHNGGGSIYGIEAWCADIAVKYPTNEVNDKWWREIDYKALKRDFLAFVCTHDLVEQVKIIEAPSDRAQFCFDGIDFLHIDGAHSPVNSVQDVILYAQKVKSGGIVVCDDINWPETELAYKLVQSMCTPLELIPDTATGDAACAVLRKK
jgi:predicted O-methyltransferase YrrM